MIRRAPHLRQYVQVDNRAIEDARLSLRAKGLLVYLLSRPSNWRAQPTHVATTTTDSVGIVRACLRELTKHGYAKLERLGSGGRGKLRGTEWVIDELPIEIPVYRDSTFTNLENPTGNKTEEENKTNKKKREGHFVPPTLSQLKEYAQRIGFKTFNADKFLAHYQANGWKVGRTAMKDWQAAVRLWRMRQTEFGSKPKPMRIDKRNEKINELNRRKADLMRRPDTADRRRELHQIDVQLFDL